MFNGDGGGAMTGNNDVINNNKRTAVVYATEAGELYTVKSERKYLLGSFKIFNWKEFVGKGLLERVCCKDSVKRESMEKTFRESLSKCLLRVSVEYNFLQEFKETVCLDSLFLD